MTNKIAVVWVNHVRTGFKTIESFQRRVIDVNPSFEFVHFFHLPKGITESGYFVPGQGWNPRGITFDTEYRTALENRLKPVEVHYTELTTEDEEIIAKAKAGWSGKGNFAGATYQYFRKTRAWRDIFAHDAEKRDEYVGFLFTRFDNIYTEDLVFPRPDQLRRQTCYAAYMDPRPECTEDRFNMFTHGCEIFLETLGERSCSRVPGMNPVKCHEILRNLFNEAQINLVALRPNNPIELSRFVDSDPETKRKFVELFR